MITSSPLWTVLCPFCYPHFLPWLECIIFDYTFMKPLQLFNCRISHVLCVYGHPLLYLTLSCLESDWFFKQLEVHGHNYCLLVCECNGFRSSLLYSDFVHCTLRLWQLPGLIWHSTMFMCAWMQLCVFCLGSFDGVWGFVWCVVCRWWMWWAHRPPNWSPCFLCPIWISVGRTC